MVVYHRYALALFLTWLGLLPALAAAGIAPAEGDSL